MMTKRLEDPAAELARIQYRLCTELTPGGSEFANNPDNCIDCARERIRSSQALGIQEAIRANRLREVNADLIATIEVMMANDGTMLRPSIIGLAADALRRARGADSPTTGSRGEG